MLTENQALIGFSIGYGISCAAVVLKLYTRIYFLGRIRIDDWLILLAWVSLTLAMTSLYIMLHNGLQSPFLTWIFYPREKLSHLLISFFIAIQLYTTGLLFCKLSLIKLYQNITNRASTLLHLSRALIILEAICISYTLISNIIAFFWCRPFHAFWTPMPLPYSEPYCSPIAQKRTIYAFSGFNIATDLCIMIIPFFFLTSASLSRTTQKLALYVLLTIGIFIIFTTIIKLVIIAQNYNPQSLIFWSFVEACVALTGACLPSLPPLIWRKKIHASVEGIPAVGGSGSVTIGGGRAGSASHMHTLGGRRGSSLKHTGTSIYERADRKKSVGRTDISIDEEEDGRIHDNIDDLFEVEMQSITSYPTSQQLPQHHGHHYHQQIPDVEIHHNTSTSKQKQASYKNFSYPL